MAFSTSSSEAITIYAVPDEMEEWGRYWMETSFTSPKCPKISFKCFSLTFLLITHLSFTAYEDRSFTTILSCPPLSSVLLQNHIIHSHVREAALPFVMPASTLFSSTIITNFESDTMDPSPETSSDCEIGFLQSQTKTEESTGWRSTHRSRLWHFLQNRMNTSRDNATVLFGQNTSDSR